MPPAAFRISPRFLGYSVVLAVGLLAFFLAAFFLREAVHTGRTVRVLFPEISTLSEGDPVAERGVTIGRVRRLSLRNDSAVAELQLFTHAFIASDARFVNFSHSLMGARMVLLLPGTSHAPLDESRVQAGFFAPGLAETLHKVRALTEQVTALRTESERILADSAWARGALGPLFSQKRLNETLASLAALSAALEDAAGTLGKDLAAATALGDSVRAGLRAREPALDRARMRIDATLTSVLALETRVAEALTTAERMGSLVGDSTVPGKLLNDRAAYDTLARLVEGLTAIAHALRDEGLGDSLKIRPRLGKPGNN